MKSVPASNKGLSKLPKEVRNKMGYKAKGGTARSKMASGGRTLSSTDASTARSTPPKTGKDASFQRMVNSVTSFLKNNDAKTLSSAISEAKKNAKELMGPKASPKEYRRPMQKKAYGGKIKK